MIPTQEEIKESEKNTKIINLRGGRHIEVSTEEPLTKYAKQTFTHVAFIILKNFTLYNFEDKNLFKNHIFLHNEYYKEFLNLFIFFDVHYSYSIYLKKNKKKINLKKVTKKKKL
jgi:hypothetical protein